MNGNVFCIRILSAALSAVLLLGTAAYASPENTLLQDTKNLARQNAELAENIPELEVWFQQQEKDVQEELSRNLRKYESECRKYAEEKTHNKGSPFYQQTYVEAFPLASGFYQDVLFEVVDGKGQPVQGAFLIIEGKGVDPLGEEFHYMMDLFADQQGQVLYRLPEGSYQISCMRQEHSEEFIVKKQVGPQKVQFFWKGKTPVQQRAELADRMEIHISDPQGQPVPNVQVWFHDWNPYGLTPNTASISENIYTDITGICVLEAPYYESGELTMRFTGTDGNSYQQSEQVVISKRTGVNEVYVCWQPEKLEPEEDSGEQVPIPSQYREVKKDFSYLNSMAQAQLEAEYQKQKRENNRLRQAMKQQQTKLLSLEQLVRQREGAEVTWIKEQYGVD